MLSAITTWPAWSRMWLIAVVVYAICKLISFWPERHRGSSRRRVAYLLWWPGLDARMFLGAEVGHVPTVREWLFALLKLTVGCGLIAISGSIRSISPMVRGWIGMIGIVFVLHFGLFHVLSCAWRSFGVQAIPLMDWPICSRSLADFWGRRWNRAFRDLTHRFLFQPLGRRMSPAAALFIAFFFSGLVHELAITVPAGGGYGGPTLYFVMQAIGLAIERSGWGRAIGLRGGWRGRLFAAGVIVGPVMLLFPRPFVLGIILPFTEFVASLT